MSKLIEAIGMGAIFKFIITAFGPAEGPVKIVEYFGWACVALLIILGALLDILNIFIEKDRRVN